MPLRIAALLVLAACGGTHAGVELRTDRADAAAAESTSARDAAPDGAADGGARRLDAYAFCERARDRVATLFCGSAGQSITSLAALKQALGLDRSFLLGHSTGLSGRLVSPINPRAVFLDFAASEDFVAAAFVRGEQRVELAAVDPELERVNFYLLEFTQDCNGDPLGCTAGDRFTDAIEHGWSELKVRDDEQLKNTAQDCRRCHGGLPGDGDGPKLLMRELETPWLHWFSQQFSTLQDDLAAARGSEAYAGVTAPDDPALLENSIGNVRTELEQGQQPLLFPSATIGMETMELTLGLTGRGPGADDPKLSPSPTWQRLYDAYRQGLGPAPPYHHERITDPAKLATASEAYQEMRAGRLAKDELPDISDVLPDDPHRLAEMSFGVEPDAVDNDLLLQACGECHNANLDSTLTRARFDADLSRVAPAELPLAIARLELPESDPAAMPPPGFRRLNDEQRKALIEYLSTVDPATVPPRELPPRGASAYELQVSLTYGGFTGSPIIADLSGDGLSDLILGTSVFVQQLDGTLSDPKPVLPQGAMGAAIVDVDGLNGLDLVALGPRMTNDSNEERGLVTFVSLGDLRFSVPIPSPGLNVQSLRADRFLDIDLDGHLDLVFQRVGFGAQAMAYMGDGNAHFEAREIVLEGAAPDIRFGIELADMTGDELTDLLLVNVESSSLGVYPHDGTAGFQTTAMWSTLPKSNVRLAAFGDADDDGRTDIVTLGMFYELGLMLQREDGTFGAPAMIASATGPVALADMNGDGRTDLVAVDSNDAVIRVLLQGPSGWTTAQSLSFRFPMSAASVSEVLAVGDLDSDGCPDVAGSRAGLVVFRGVGCIASKH